MAKITLTLEDNPDGSVQMIWESDQGTPFGYGDDSTLAENIAVNVNGYLNSQCTFDTSECAMSETSPEAEVTWI